jgi:hypothetical protein
MNIDEEQIKKMITKVAIGKNEIVVKPLIDNPLPEGMEVMVSFYDYRFYITGSNCNTFN